MKIKPCGDIIIGRLLKQTTTTPGGLFMPTESEHAKMEIIAVGPGLKTEKGVIEPYVKVGDIALIPRQSGMNLKIEEQSYIALHEDNIICILED